jgi:elongation factor 1-gamma
MKLHTLKVSSRGSTVAMALDEAGLAYTIDWTEFSDLMPTPSPKIANVNPYGQIPILETEHGPICETFAILRFAARKANKLYGNGHYEHALVDQWLSWCNTNVLANIPQFLYTTYGFPFPQLQANNQVYQKAKDGFIGVLAYLNSQLQGKKFLVGDSLTIADIGIIGYIYSSLAFCFGDKERQTIPNVIAWIENFATHASFKKWYGRTRWIPVAAKIPKLEFPKEQPKEQPKKEEKKKEEKPKKEEAADDEIAEPKIKEPVFPETQLNLMTFKTAFVNEKDLDAAMASFWEQFKPTEYTLYHLKYIKYPGECEIVYRTNNLLRGFLSKIEHIRKYLFGTHAIIGDEPSLEIEGVWLIRGTELFDLLKEIDSFDTYEWIKLDPTTEATKALVKEYWCSRAEDESKWGGKVVRTFKWIK